MKWHGFSGEVIRALATLALILLNFAHVPLSNAASPLPDTAAWDLTSYCGDLDGGPDSTAHAPCHACRIGAGAILPPVPGLARPAFADHTVLPAPVVESLVEVQPRRAARPRGPPAA